MKTVADSLLLINATQIGGPMWGAPIHDKDFVNEMLEHVKEHSTEFGTASRIEGMLTIAKQVSPCGSSERTQLTPLSNRVAGD